MSTSLQSNKDPGTTLVDVQDVTRSLGEKVKQTILYNIQLKIPTGQFVALTGHSGSGKSTLLYLLGALDRPTAGRIIIDGTDISRLDDNGRAKLRREKLGFVFQFHFLLPEFNVLENVMIPMLRKGLSFEKAKEQAAETLDSLGLGDLMKRRTNELSGGQQQRVSVARAVASRPALLLADEPTGNLDSKNAELVMGLFETLNRERGMTLIMVTHDTSFAERSMRQIVLKDGRIIQDKEQTK